MDQAAQAGCTATEGIESLAVASPAVPTFAEVYEAHVRFVWRTVRRLGVPDADCDDAVQDVFLVVHRKLHEYRPEAPIAHWLFRIASRIAHDHWRSGRRKNPREHGLVPVSSEDIADTEQQSPADSAERAAAARLIRDVLLDLDEPRREVFILAELEQMTAPEIAGALEIPLNTVYSRLRRARLDFEEALAHRGEQRIGKEQ
jgi:RNA polymerase sigma-70 factor, ECF subfamily